MKAILLSLSLIFSVSSFGQIKGKVVAKKGGLSDYSDVVISIKEGKTLKKLPTMKKEEKVWQKDKQFAPRAKAIRVGDSVSFPNKDDIFHNVFSLDPKNKFDLGLFKGSKAFKEDKKTEVKKKNSVAFSHPGEIHVFCNIHKEMSAKLLIFDHGYFAHASKDGSFTLPNPGKNEVTLLIQGPRIKGTIEKKIAYPLKGELQIEFNPLEEVAAIDHKKKDGKDYDKKWSLDDEDFY